MASKARIDRKVTDVTSANPRVERQTLNEVHIFIRKIMNAKLYFRNGTVIQIFSVNINNLERQFESYQAAPKPADRVKGIQCNVDGGSNNGKLTVDLAELIAIFR